MAWWGESITWAHRAPWQVVISPVGCDKDLDLAIDQNRREVGYAERINLERLVMTVKIQNSALSISESLDSLKVTPLPMHRITFMIKDTKQWYAIMKEARALYNKDWRSQPHAKRRLERYNWNKQMTPVWFEVPDPSFASWCAVKLAVEATMKANK